MTSHRSRTARRMLGCDLDSQRTATFEDCKKLESIEPFGCSSLSHSTSLESLMNGVKDSEASPHAFVAVAAADADALSLVVLVIDTFLSGAVECFAFVASDLTAVRVLSREV